MNKLLTDAQTVTILTVDDETLSLHLLKLILQREGYSHIYEAVDGVIGLEMARELRPDLIISGGMMPRMTGWELLAAVRADPLLRDTPFLFHTARADQHSRDTALTLGADLFLTKPYNPLTMRDHIRDLLSRPRTAVEE